MSRNALLALLSLTMLAHPGPAEGLLGRDLATSDYGPPGSVPSPSLEEWRSDPYEPGEWYPRPPGETPSLRALGRGVPEAPVRIPHDIRDVGPTPDFEGAPTKVEEKAGVQVRVSTRFSPVSLEFFWVRIEVSGTRSTELDAAEIAPFSSTIHREGSEGQRLDGRSYPYLHRGPEPLVLERPLFERGWVRVRARFLPPVTPGRREVRQVVLMVQMPPLETPSATPDQELAFRIDHEATVFEVERPPSIWTGRSRGTSLGVDHRSHLSPDFTDPGWRNVRGVLYDADGPFYTKTGTFTGYEPFVRQNGMEAEVRFDGEASRTIDAYVLHATDGVFLQRVPLRPQGEATGPE